MKKWLLLMCWPLAVAAGEALELERLMQSLAAITAVDARFEETKQLAILEEPLVMTGTLRYRAPGYVRKHTRKPHEEIFEVDQDWLTIEHPAEGIRHLSLNGYPEVHAFVESIRATLAGDLQSLRRHYRVQLRGTADDWTLRLEPADPAMAEYISAIVIRGQGDRIASIETLETDGDRSLMRVDIVSQRRR